jgi:integrase
MARSAHLISLPSAPADDQVATVQLDTELGHSRSDFSPTTALHNPAQLYLMSLGDTTREKVRTYLDMLANLLEPGADATSYAWSSMTVGDAARLRQALATKYPASPQTANLHLGVVRSVMRQAYLTADLDTRTYEAIVATLKRFKSRPIPAGREVAQDELRRFLGHLAADDTARGKRDLAMFALLFATGARRDEVRRATTADIDLHSRTWRIPRTKTGAGRVVKLAPWTVKPLAGWLMSATGES